MIGYIYCIENKINGKKYVGKTTKNINERFEEHKRESKLERSKTRLLYKAIQKYGLENFTITQLESIKITKLAEREMFWISKLNTCVYNENNNGYNLTLGGEGSVLYEFSEEELFNYLKERYTYEDIAEVYGCSKDTISKWIKYYELDVINKNKQFKQRKTVLLIEKNIEFNSIGDAAQWVLDNNISSVDKESIRINIGRCCNEKRKSAYKYTWKYI
jgi:group I intron endonuclease